MHYKNVLLLEIHTEQWSKAVRFINIDNRFWLWWNASSLSDRSFWHVFWVDGKCHACCICLFLVTLCVCVVILVRKCLSKPVFRLQCWTTFYASDKMLSQTMAGLLKQEFVNYDTQ